MKFLTRLLLLVMLQSGAMFAQSPFLQHYSLWKKSDAIQVNVMFQDRAGFMWFGTNKGLFKFNGKSYQHYTVKDNLPTETITTIAQDSLGRIWTGHNNGKIAFFEDKKFHTFETEEGSASEAVSDLLFDKRGTLWFSTLNDGVYYYLNNRLHRLDDVEGMPDLFVYDLHEDETGRIWAGTDGGVAICSLLNGKVSIETIDYADGLTDNIVRKIEQDEKGNFWFGTQDAGIIQYNAKTSKIESLAKAPWQYGAVTDFIFRKGKIWISVASHGLVVYDTFTQRVKEYNQDTGFRPVSVMRLTKDVENNIWCASKTGVYRTSGDELEFVKEPVSPSSSSNVLSIASDENNNVWYSTMDGLFKRSGNGTSNVTTTNILAKTAYRDFRVISLYIDSKNFIWAGLYGEGVLRIDPVTNSIRHIVKELRNGNILNITGKGNVIWLATLGGGEKITYTGNQLTFQNYSTDNGLSSDFIYQVFIDSKDRVWFATDGKGVDVLDKGKIEHLEAGLTSKVVYGFAEDGEHHVWANVQDGGLQMYNERKLFLIEPVRPHEPLRDAHIASVASDVEGNLVITHDLGIDVFSTSTNTVRYLGEESQLPFQKANLNATYTDREGTIYFGTEGGIIHYTGYPQEKSLPAIVIDNLKVHGKDRKIINGTTFNHYENNVTISFIGFWYQNPDLVNFRYKLDNYDENYISTSDNAVTYSQLPPGEYTFRVVASSTAAADLANESTFTFTINPPFWKTPVFYVLSTFLVLAAIYFFVRYRERRLVEEKLELEAKVEERTREIQRNTEEIQAQNEEILAQAEEIKGINENLEMLVVERTNELEKKNIALEEYAFINAHKLRSPVASILGLINLLHKAPLTDEAKTIHSHMQRSAEELDEIVRSITKALERGNK